MNTPSHLIFGAAAFGRPGRTGVTWAAVLGGFLPDLSLYLLAGGAIFILGISPGMVFDQLYFSSQWQAIFAIDNSFVLWGIGLSIGLWMRHDMVVAFAGSAILHLLFDLMLHHDDARRHFWPVSDWVFVSPISYWDRRYYGDIIGPLEISASLILCLVLWRRFSGKPQRIVIGLASLSQIAPLVIWGLVFSSGGHASH